MPRRRRPPRPGALADLSPLRILAQIVLLQFIYYAVAMVLIVFTTLVAGKHPDAALLFSWKNLRGDITEGWTLGLCWMMDSLICVIPILIFIARSKLVPDFALTIHFINLVVVSLYERSVPINIFWWAVQIASAALMISLGIWACQWRELQPITFGGKSKERSTETANETLEEGMGLMRGGDENIEMDSMASRAPP